MAFLIYDVATGLVARVALTDEMAEALRQAGHGEAVVECEGSDATHYVVAGMPVLRPELPVPADMALAVGEVWTIPGIPDGALVYIDGAEVGRSEGDLVIRFDEPATYQMRLEGAGIWRDATCTVTVA